MFGYRRAGELKIHETVWRDLVRGRGKLELVASERGVV